MGIQESAFNLALKADIPETFHDLNYQMVLQGKSCQLDWQGKGKYFHHISWDGQEVNSAVIFRPVERIRVVRGIPGQPYLAECNGLLEDLEYSPGDRRLRIRVNAWKKIPLQFLIISPIKLKQVLHNNKLLTDLDLTSSGEAVFEYKIHCVAEEGTNYIICQFLKGTQENEQE
jgi:hypothetical protein